MPLTKGEVTQKADPFRQQEIFKKDPGRSFSDEEIRTRAYQIYESGDRNGNHSADDWSQAEIELMELLHAKSERVLSRDGASPKTSSGH